MDEKKISTVHLWGTYLPVQQHSLALAAEARYAFLRQRPVAGELRWLAQLPISHNPLPLFSAYWHVDGRLVLGILISETKPHMPVPTFAECEVEQNIFERLRQVLRAHDVFVPQASLLSLPLVYCEFVVANPAANTSATFPACLSDGFALWNRVLTSQWFTLFEGYITPARVTEVEEELYALYDGETLKAFGLGRC